MRGDTHTQLRTDIGPTLLTVKSTEERRERETTPTTLSSHVLLLARSCLLLCIHVNGVDERKKEELLLLGFTFLPSISQASLLSKVCKCSHG